VSNLIALAADSYQRISHHIGEFKILELFETAVVEGTTEGATVAGLSWDGRATLGGRFCNVFEIQRERRSW
jgi:hypothetical protein